MVTVTDAVIFVQAGRFHANAARCLDYCTEMQYEVAGLICGDWPAAERMVRDGLASVIVVPSAPGNAPAPGPRVEVVPKRTETRRRTAGIFGYGPRLAAR
jgi:hypothetical protein